MLTEILIFCLSSPSSPLLDCEQEETKPKCRVVDVFCPGMLRTPVFRIPSVLPLPAGSGGHGIVLAFAEGRPGLHDAGRIDLVMRRSTDGGVTWAAPRAIVRGHMLSEHGGQATVGNPTAIFDATTGRVLLLLCSNHPDDAEWMIHAREGVDSRRVWLTSSDDFGETWARPKEITGSVKRKHWTWYAVGPGVGVQLTSGRLIAPANHAEAEALELLAQDVFEPERPYLPTINRSRMVAHCIYSDDHGETWCIGGLAARHTNETQLAQLGNGDVILNSRDWSGVFKRVVQLSKDFGSSWRSPRYDDELIEPRPQGCQGSLLALPVVPSQEQVLTQPHEGEQASARKRRWPLRSASTSAHEAGIDLGTLLFCNPSSDKRERLTVRKSEDGGKTWSSSYLLEEGPSAYSCMGKLDADTVCVLYERADRISYAILPLSLLK
ncbi:MAG: hypothetical protein SGPRY_013102 [Prymnesium sp.]